MSLFDDLISRVIGGLNLPSRPGMTYYGDGWPIGEVVAEICLRAGLSASAVDFGGLSGTVDGISLNNRNPAYTALEELARVFLFDPASYDGKLHFVPRGEPAVVALTLDDLIDDDEEIESSERGDAIEVPRKLHINYFDTDGGLNPDKQTSDRSLDSRAVAEENLETQVIMRHADAARWVVIAHKIAIEEQRGEVKFSLPDSFLYLTPGDVVALEGMRLRITEIEIDEGQQNYVCKRDRASAYQSAVQGIAPEVPSDPPDIVMGDTVAALLDVPMLRDADDALYLYTGYSGTTDNWQGAFVETSLDGGLTWDDQTLIGTGTIMGELLDPLPAAGVWLPDPQTVRVQLYMSDMELTGCTLADMLNRANRAAIGSEMISFADAQPLGGNVWEIGYMLRGRRGSEIPAEHPVGTRFVLLQRPALRIEQVSAQLIGRQIQHRVTSAGGDSQSVYSLTYTGQTQRELPVGYLTAERAGGQIAVTWQGAGRLGGSAQVIHGQGFAGYRVWINGTPQDTASQTLTVTDPGGSVTIEVAQINSITGAGPVRSITI